ncbi:MAG: glutamyl-tRNA amidotransferase [Nautiliaceae bacterium]|jgi:predicted permease
MDKVPFWFIVLSVVVLVGGSFLIYLWLKSLIPRKDSDDNS